jgi:hypothetical protein
MSKTSNLQRLAVLKNLVRRFKEKQKPTQQQKTT